MRSFSGDRPRPAEASDLGGEASRLRVEGENVVEIITRRAGQLLQHLPRRCAAMSRKPMPTGEERRDRDLVGGVQYGGRRRRPARKAPPGQPQRREALEVGRLEVEAGRCAARSRRGAGAAIRSGQPSV